MVIGIIIAVQIGNLIENNKRHELQIEVLNEIQNNLEFDVREISEEVQNYRLMQVYDSTLLVAARQRLPFTDLLCAYAYALEISGHMNPTLSGYKLLQSRGIDLITDDSLRISITDLYERWYTYYMKYESERIQIAQSVIKPYMIKNFYQERDTTFWTGRKRIPMNYDALMKDPEWTSIIQTNEGLAGVMINKARSLEDKIKKIQNRITSYLDQQRQ